jgi:four helix bundle protein
VSGGYELGANPTRGYRKLLAFEAAHEMVKMTYRATDAFPRSEQFGLTSQMRRAAVSVAANIVEGYVLSSTAQFTRHLDISFGSCKELEYYFDLAGDLGYVNEAELEKAQHMCGRAAYMILSLSRSLKKPSRKEVTDEEAPALTVRRHSTPSTPSTPPAEVRDA